MLCQSGPSLGRFGADQLDEFHHRHIPAGAEPGAVAQQCQIIAHMRVCLQGRAIGQLRAYPLPCGIEQIIGLLQEEAGMED